MPIKGAYAYKKRGRYILIKDIWEVYTYKKYKSIKDKRYIIIKNIILTITTEKSL